MGLFDVALNFVKGGVREVLELRQENRPVYMPATNTPVYETDELQVAFVVAPADEYSVMEQTSFTVGFVAYDEATAEYLTTDQPAVVLVLNQDTGEELGSVVTPLEVGIPDTPAFPGNYQLIVLVYLDWGLETLDAAGLRAFTVEPGEPPFHVDVPLVSDEGQIDALLGSDETLIGNNRTSVYHDPECHLANRIAAEHQRYFVSFEDAEDAGFRSCSKCIVDLDS